MRVLGIDPGLVNMGWGVIENHEGQLKYIAHGTMKPPTKAPFSERLRTLHLGLKNIISHYQPQTCAVEETFVNVNAQSTLKLGMARGVIMLAPALHDVEVHEYSANKVKKSVVGQGHAAKEQVGHMVRLLLPTAPTTITDDAADALAVAICHSHYAQSRYNGY